MSCRASSRARPKAKYLEFETVPDLEFEFYLCQKLGGMTVDEMRQRMSADEYLGWAIYYGRKAQREELARLKGGGR